MALRHPGFASVVSFFFFFFFMALSLCQGVLTHKDFYTKQSTELVGQGTAPMRFTELFPKPFRKIRELIGMENNDVKNCIDAGTQKLRFLSLGIHFSQCFRGENNFLQKGAGKCSYLGRKFQKKKGKWNKYIFVTVFGQKHCRRVSLIFVSTDNQIRNRHFCDWTKFSENSDFVAIFCLDLSYLKH